MRRLLAAALLTTVLASSSGCGLLDRMFHCRVPGGPACGPGCNTCGDVGYAPGPPVGTVTYPYYTTRGPRDFLASNPRDIGP